MSREIDKNLPEKRTNADRIRGMSDEELADMLKIGYALWCDASCLDNGMKGTCKDCILEWLKKEVDV